MNMTKKPTTQFSARYIGYGWEVSVAGPEKRTMVFKTVMAMLSWINKNLEVPVNPPVIPPDGSPLALAA